jgi:RNA polymerase sigma-70 factor (ECF subfamily)
MMTRLYKRFVRDPARDAALIARMAAGDEHALETLIALYGEPLRDFAYLTLRNADSAEDVTQDLFVDVWERRATLSISGTVADYLFRAVRNRALDMIKHETAQKRLRDALGQQFVIDPTALSDAADAELATHEFATAVESALQALTPRVRETFLMHRVHGMTYTEITVALGLSVATVQSQVSRAAKQISDYLEPFL